MDILCARCGEPWEVQAVSEGYVSGEPGWTFGATRAHVITCPCCPQRAPQSDEARALTALIAQLSGDDLDGAASDLEDAARLGLL